LTNRNCPTDISEQAERYQLGLLLPEEAAIFEEHFLACEHCTGELERAEAYVSAMRSAAGRIGQPADQVLAGGGSA
jgi:anti-sigma factor RsiW